MSSEAARHRIPTSRPQTIAGSAMSVIKAAAVQLAEIGHAQQGREGQSPHSQTGLKLGAI